MRTTLGEENHGTASQDEIAESNKRIPLGMHDVRERSSIEDARGQLILKKAVLVPEREVWLHKTPRAKKSVQKGIQQAKKKLLKGNAIHLGDPENS